MSTVPQSHFDELMRGDYWNYPHIYETPFSRHLATVLIVLNRHEDFGVMAQGADPQEAVLQVLRNMDEVDDDRPLFEGFDKSEALALIYLGQRDRVQHRAGVAAGSQADLVLWCR